MLIYDEIVTRYFKEYEKEINDRATQRDQNPSGKAGKLKQINEVKGGSLTYKLIGWQFIYQSLEVGRGETRNGGNGALRRNIEKWLVNKRIASVYDAEKMSWAISRKIHKQGTRLHRNQDDRFGRPSGTITDTINNNNIKQLVKDLGAATVKEIMKDFYELLIPGSATTF